MTATAAAFRGVCRRRSRSGGPYSLPAFEPAGVFHGHPGRPTRPPERITMNHPLYDLPKRAKAMRRDAELAEGTDAMEWHKAEKV